MPGFSRLPTVKEDYDDPKAADEVYAAVTRLLINERRDAKVFPLIYKENVNYVNRAQEFWITEIEREIAASEKGASACALFKG